MLNIYFRLKKAEDPLPAGHLAAYNQIPLSGYEYGLTIANVTKSNEAVVLPVFADNDERYLILKGEDFRLEFNKSDGFISLYESP